MHSNKMRAILITTFFCLSLSVRSQQLYIGVNGGIDMAGMPAYEPAIAGGSVEGKMGYHVNDSRWSFETGYRSIHVSTDYDYVYDSKIILKDVVSVPLTIRYDLPFMFLRGGYTSLFRKEEEVLRYSTYPSYYYLHEKKAIYYSAGLTLGLGLEKNISESWKVNMHINMITSLTSFNQYHGHRSAHFFDYNFLVGIDYYFKIKRNQSSQSQ
jgi:hypothetical protein